MLPSTPLSSTTSIYGRNADIYVFAHHPVHDASADHREPSQWQFYVVAACRLPCTKQLSLSGVQRLALPVGLAGLTYTVEMLRLEVKLA